MRVLLMTFTLKKYRQDSATAYWNVVLEIFGSIGGICLPPDPTSSICQVERKATFIGTRFYLLCIGHPAKLSALCTSARRESLVGLLAPNSA